MTNRSQLIWIYTVFQGRTYPGSAGLGLTHLCMKSNERDIGNQYSPRSDASTSRSTLFALNIGISIKRHNNETKQAPLLMEKDLSSELR